MLFIRQSAYNKGMGQKTKSNDNSMDATFVVDFLATIMRYEISNRVRRCENRLLVKLTNHTVAQITAPKVAPETLPPKQTQAQIHNIATVRYVMQHDYGYDGKNRKHALNRLTLHNFEECKTYIEDAVNSQLNAYYTNGLIEFMNGEKFLLKVELKQKQ